MGDKLGELDTSQNPPSYCYSFAFAAFLQGLASCLVSVFAFLFIAFMFSLMCFFQRRQSLTRSPENAALNTRNRTPPKSWRNGIWLGFDWNHVRGTKFWGWLFLDPSSFTPSRCSFFFFFPVSLPRDGIGTGSGIRKSLKKCGFSASDHCRYGLFFDTIWLFPPNVTYLLFPLVLLFIRFS